MSHVILGWVFVLVFRMMMMMVIFVGFERIDEDLNFNVFLELEI
jgi:hypothetical protein